MKLLDGQIFHIMQAMDEQTEAGRDARQLVDMFLTDPETHEKLTFTSPLTVEDGMNVFEVGNERGESRWRVRYNIEEVATEG